MAMSFASDQKIFSLQIQRMSEGGFLVLDGYRSGEYCGARFAASSIEEVLKYCKLKLDAEHAEAR